MTDPLRVKWSLLPQEDGAVYVVETWPSGHSVRFGPMPRSSAPALIDERIGFWEAQVDAVKRRQREHHQP